MEFLLISLVIILGVVSPGPDFVLVSRNALRYSHQAGIMTALGISCGSAFQATICILGFALIISESILLFNIIKCIGAAYLIYLGCKGLLEKKSNEKMNTKNSNSEISNFYAFNQGLLCNLLNPKAICFFIAFFTSIITPSTTLIKQIGYDIEFFFAPFLWFSFIAIMFSHKKFKAVIGKFQFYMMKIFGFFLIFFGLKIATLIQ